MTPSWQILVGDCRERLAELVPASVQTCVTSPPYWGLRDYEAEGQIGLEPTLDEFIAEVVGVFREVRRVLHDDGTLWVNMGDAYVAGQGGRQSAAGALPQSPSKARPSPRERTDVDVMGWGERAVAPRAFLSRDTGLKPKDVMGQPWMLAFALRADGWYLRSDIIWHKPSPMPESVTDRPTKAHEYLFLLSKQPRYFYDAAAIREPDKGTDHARKVLDGQPSLEPSGGLRSPHRGLRTPEGRDGLGANKRSVWTVNSQGYSGAHFATFPPKLIEPCILAGSREGDTVLDPFAGAGTTGLVALRRNRSFVGVELNEDYAELARARIRDDAPLFNTGAEKMTPTSEAAA